jgi:hypothetical protein
VHRLVRTVGAEDRHAHMLLHLPPGERAWSACALLCLQRLHCPIPALMPPHDDGGSSLHSEATSKRAEAGGPVPDAVVGEDDVLLLRSVGEHAWRREREGSEVGQRRDESVHARNRVFLRRASAYENEKRTVEKESMDE